MVHQLISIHSFQQHANSFSLPNSTPTDTCSSFSKYVPSMVSQWMIFESLPNEITKESCLISIWMRQWMSIQVSYIYRSNRDIIPGLWSRNQVGKAPRNRNRVWRPDLRKYNRNRTFSIGVGTRTETIVRIRTRIGTRIRVRTKIETWTEQRPRSEP